MGITVSHPAVELRLRTRDGRYVVRDRNNYVQGVGITPVEAEADFQDGLIRLIGLLEVVEGVEVDEQLQVIYGSFPEVRC